jgi:hypothetical protein
MKEERPDERARLADSNIENSKDERKFLNVIMLGCLMASLLKAVHHGDYK